MRKLPAGRNRCLARVGLVALAMLAAKDGRSANRVLEVGGARIEVTIAQGPFDLPEATITAWVENAAKAVTTYYGRFPVKNVRVNVHAGAGGRGVSHGTTFGWGGAHIRITVGEHATQRDLDHDWMMTHEFVHLAFPDVAEEHHWIEEGLATYVEPFARAQAGGLSPEQVWEDIVRDMHQGEPEEGDRGLDNTHTWGRTYWGGALFCLVADVRIRETTHNRYGLRDALKGILKAGGSIETDWSLEHTLAVADQAVGTRVLEQLYGEMKDKPVDVDLSAIWAKLGIEPGFRRVTFRGDAGMASAREAMTSP